MESKEFPKQRNICTMYKTYAEKSTSGITLIALVVTIIVLLILAGISINLILGENGIITKATMAKEAQEMAQLKEEAELVKATGLAENLSKVDGEYGKADLLEDLNNNFEGSALGSDRITTSDGKYDIIVDDDLNIEVVEHGTIKQEARKIIITSSIAEKDGKEYIDLIFEVEGMDPYEEYYFNYIDECMYSDKSTEELESMYIEIVNVENEADGIELITELTDSDREEIMKFGNTYFMTETYEQSLKTFLLTISTIKENTEITSQQELFRLTAIKINVSAVYNYICDCVYEERYDNATEIENQILRGQKYDGDFESMMGITREELQTEASEMGLTYEEFLKYIIAFESAIAEVKVSNGDSFTTPIIAIETLDITNTYSYEITQDGEYIFNAETPIAKGQTTVVKESEVLDPDGWEAAWTCTDGTTWSEKIINDGTTELPTEGVIAKLYNTGNTITPQLPEGLGGAFLDEGSEYKLVFEGSGSMAPLNIANQDVAWMKTGDGIYVTEVIITEGITNIPDSAFGLFISLEKIQIAETIENIGASAFNLCYKLTSSITIPEEMTSIGDDTFIECRSIKEIILHDGITSIGANAFKNCSSVTNSISIPENVTYIGSNAFEGCSGIKEITIPNGITEISYGAFGYCSNLTSITIPSSVTSINDFAFRHCTKLTSIEIPDTVQSIGKNIFYGCSELVNVKLSSNISTISEGAFQGCTKLKTITIPNNVTSIDAWAFRDCTSLETIDIPDSVTLLGQQAFENCTSLESVKLSSNITRIADTTFYNCSALTAITIPSKVTAIGNSAFENCSSLKSVTILSNTYVALGSNTFMGLPTNSYIYVPNSTVQSKFIDGTNYDSTKTTISIK